GVSTGRAIALAVLAVAVVATAGAARAEDRNVQPVGEPDAYVASWDAVGNQALTAAALTPAEGHVIFAYAGIAVYDSVIAIDGGYEPFAVDLEAPHHASA